MTLPGVFGGVRATPLAGETATMRAAQRDVPIEARPNDDSRGSVNVRLFCLDGAGTLCVLCALCAHELFTLRAGCACQRYSRSVGLHFDGLQEPMLPRNGDRPARSRGWELVRRHTFAARHDDASEGFLCTDRVEFTLLQCLRSVDFWLLTVAVSACTGASLAFINNASSLVRSLGGDDTTTVRTVAA